MKTPKILLFVGFAALTACGGLGKPAQSVANQAVQNIGCKAAQSEMWNSLYRIAEESAAFPTAVELRLALLKAGSDQGFHGANFARYVAAFVSNYEVTINGIKDKFAPQDPLAWKKALAEMEVGVRITVLHAELQDQISNSLNKLDAAENNLQATCNQPDVPVVPPTNSASTVWDQLKATQTPEVYGARKALAVAYQSCDVLALKPMTSATPDVQGITDLGVGPDGIGHVRKISSLAQVVASDYYIHNENPAKSSCFQVHSDPLIYNYGGKPFTSTDNTLLLDLFTHVTTGGPSLGIDCSAYIFSALALAGLKMDPDPKKILKADLVWGIGSDAFKDPEVNGLRCLQKISVDAQTSILAGDIVAINGHVLMIDSIGADPLAISAIKTVADCTSSKINPSAFDFVIAQSSAVANGIGINRIRGADYMPRSATIRQGFVDYAVAACRAKFGFAANLSSPDLSIVRHLKTPECLAPEPLVMAHENCVNSCKPL